MWIRNLLTEKTLRTILPHVMLHIRLTTNFIHYHMKRTISILLIIFSLTSCLTTKHEITRSQPVTNESNSKLNNESNQSTLSSVALNDKDIEVRKLAVEKLTIQSTLSSVALNDNDAEIRKLAVSKLDIQSTLSSVALNDKDIEVRKLAVEKLT